MPKTQLVAVKDLSLDLRNYRTVEQTDEANAIEAMISASPDRFWALADSLIADGYLPTESIIVLREGSTLTVREGNRRVAVLKMLLKLMPLTQVSVSNDFTTQLSALPAKWRKDNRSVPCTIYDKTEKDTVERIVRLAHGKGEKAGRDQWNAVARARHNRDQNGSPEPALDLLEKYLASSKHVTSSQKARWAGVFPLSILAEALKKLAQRLGSNNATALVHKYPSILRKDVLDAIIHDIGLEKLGFDHLRNKDVDFAISYGLPPLPTAVGSPAKKKATGGSSTTTTSKSAKQGAKAPVTPASYKAVASGNPKAVKRLMKDFVVLERTRESRFPAAGGAEARHQENSARVHICPSKHVRDLSKSLLCRPRLKWALDLEKWPRPETG